MVSPANPFPVYLKAIEQNLRNGDATEHTHRPALKTLLESLKSGITATNEPKRVDCGAPDYSIARRTSHGPLTIGYVEAKDVGLSLHDAERSEQLKRYYLPLHNLILTDYLEFRWYVDGQTRMTARLARTGPGGRLLAEKDGAAQVRDLLLTFLDNEPAAISKPKDLAERMARLTHMVRDIIETAGTTGKASSSLIDLRAAFQTTLIPDLDIPQFADMFAQTLAYGLFAARVNHRGAPGTFQRNDAAREIPRSNPFLRRLLGNVAGPDFEDEPFAGFVDDLTQLLSHTDMDAVLADFGKRTKQEDPVVHFYETFLAAYNPKLRESRGVYYTPEPVVSYIVRSVDHLLRTQFGCAGGLADTGTVTYQRTASKGERESVTTPRVLVLDPACGTGTFLYAVVDHIRETFRKQGNAGMWSGFVKTHLLPRLSGFELLMAPYAVAHLKLGLQLAGQDLDPAERTTWAYEFAPDERLGIYLTNSLEEAIMSQEVGLGRFISEEANAAAEIKREKPIMVVIGNPPYSGHSANASTRKEGIQHGGEYQRRVKGQWVPTKATRALELEQPTFIGKLLDDYYQVDGRSLGERNPKWLQDDYVKFLRFGQWRIQQTGSGVLAFITNHGYLDNPTFRGMRQQLLNTFTDIYILNLHGNSKKGEVSPVGGKDENVFDIQQGVAIGIFVKEAGKSGPARVHHAELWGSRDQKYSWLFDNTIQTTAWQDVQPESPSYYFIPQIIELRPEFEDGWDIASVLTVHNMGLNSHRDGFVIGFDKKSLQDRIAAFIRSSGDDETVRDRFETGSLDIPKSRELLRSDLKWETRIIPCLYRPFDTRELFFHDKFVDRPRADLNHHMQYPNLSLVTTRRTRESYAALATNLICGQHKITAAYEGSLVFPLYLYPTSRRGQVGQASMAGLSPWPEGKDGRRPNLSPDFVQDMEQRLGLTFVPDGRGNLETTFGPEDIFFYIYAVLHAPGYRSRYAEFLKIDFPRIPLTRDVDLFRDLVAKGGDLVGLHLLESPLLAQPVTRYPINGGNEVEAGYPKYVAPGEAAPVTGEPVEQGRVYINKGDAKAGKPGQYFEGVPPEVWEFHVGGYQVCEKWLKDRRGRKLTYEDISHYHRIVVALQETVRLMEEIDEAIPGWPLT